MSQTAHGSRQHEFIPGFYLPATPAQVEIQQEQKKSLQKHREICLFGPSPLLIVESKRVRKYWFALSLIRILNLAFIIVELVLMLSMYYRIPNEGYTCAFRQTYHSYSIIFKSGVGLLTCRIGIILPLLAFPLFFAWLCISILCLLKVWTFYKYLLLFSLVQILYVLGLFGVWVFAAIYILISLVLTCSNQVCSNGFWPNQVAANWIVIFNWIIVLIWVS
jgi:hypothetical protein